MSGLWQETGHASKQERANEACTLTGMLAESEESMEPHEATFFRQMYERCDKWGSETFVSAKQLFWLRDLKDKYL